MAVALALLAALACGLLAWSEYRRTQELFTPWLLILVFALLDVFLPAAVFLILEPPSFVSWIIPLEDDDIASATLVYLVALVLFGAGYFSVWRRPTGGRDRESWSALADVELKVGRVYAGLAVTGGWYVLHQAALIGKAGSLDVYLSETFRQRFRPEVYQAANVFDFFFNQLAPSMLPAFLVLVGILFFFRYRLGRPLLWGFVLPVVGWLLTLTTFYRGSQLNLFLSLAFLETCRVRVAKLRPEAGLARRRAPSPATTIMSARSKVLASVGLLLFVFYGAYRQYNSSFQYGEPVSVSEAFTSQSGEFLRGWGLVGLTSILHVYPASTDHLGGSSLTSTMIMPIPRLLWPEKPERYGAEVVTRRMGWPTTTQSAVTMPGELYANFGAIGVFLVGAFGLAFGAVYRHRLRPRFFFVYVSFVPQAVLLTQWMSSTGFMTSLTLFPVALAAAFWVQVRSKTDAPHEGQSGRRSQRFDGGSTVRWQRQLQRVGQ